MIRGIISPTNVATVRAISARWAFIAAVLTKGRTSPAAVPRAGQTAPKLAKRCHEEEHLHGRAADLDTPLTEVDLQLLTGARLEPDRCPCLCSKSLAQGGHRTFHSPQADGDTPLSSQFLPNENRPPADQTPVENQPDTLGSCDDSRPG